MFERLGRKGTGVVGREERNYEVHINFPIFNNKNRREKEILTELAALNKAIKLAWTTS